MSLILERSPLYSCDGALIITPDGEKNGRVSIMTESVTLSFGSQVKTYSWASSMYVDLVSENSLKVFCDFVFSCKITDKDIL